MNSTSGSETDRPATRSGTFAIGGDLPVHRLGFGAMQITGAGVWGEPADHAESIAVLRRVVELGIDLIAALLDLNDSIMAELERARP